MPVSGFKYSRTKDVCTQIDTTIFRSHGCMVFGFEGTIHSATCHRSPSWRVQTWWRDLPAEVGQDKLRSGTAAASSFRLPREIGCISEVLGRNVRFQSCSLQCCKEEYITKHFFILL